MSEHPTVCMGSRPRSSPKESWKHLDLSSCTAWEGSPWFCDWTPDCVHCFKTRKKISNKARSIWDWVILASALSAVASASLKACSTSSARLVFLLFPFVFTPFFLPTHVTQLEETGSQLQERLVLLPLRVQVGFAYHNSTSRVSFCAQSGFISVQASAAK